MNYIELINRFWLVDLEACFSHLEVHLYFKLLEISNKLGWPDGFKYPNSRLEADVGTRSKNLIQARQRLIDYDLISYKKGNTRHAGYYRLLTKSLSFEPTKESNQESNSESNQGNNKEVIRGTLNKLNKTKLNEFDNPPDPPGGKDETKIPDDKPLPIPKAFGTIGTKRKRFVKPSQDEIQEHYAKKCAEKGISVRKNFGERFFCHYESNGWKVGRNPMKSWKHAVLTWINNDYGKDQEHPEKPGKTRIDDAKEKFFARVAKLE